MAGWYVRRGENVIGPIDPSKLKALADDGKLHPSDQLSEDAAGPWTEARRSPLFVNRPEGRAELSPSPPARPPALPPSLAPRDEPLITQSGPQPSQIQPAAGKAEVAVRMGKTVATAFGRGTVAVGSAVARSLSTRSQRRHELKLAKIQAEALVRSQPPQAAMTAPGTPATFAPQIVQTTIVNTTNRNTHGCLSGCAVLLLLIIIYAIVSSILSNKNPSSSTNQPSASPSPAPAEPGISSVPSPAPTEEWTDAGQTIQQGNIQVKVTNVAVDFVPLKDFGEAKSKDQLLMISLNIANTDPSKKIDYKGWGANWADFSGANRASVRDDLGNTYTRVHFGLGTKVVGQVESGESIYPNKSISDVVVFEPPVETCKYLLLELPAAAFSGDGALKIKIPRSMIATPGDREQKRSQAEADANAKRAENENQSLAVEAKRREDEKRRIAAEAKQREEEAKQQEDAKYRLWTSADGKHTTEAKFIKAINGIIYLEKRDGTTAKVPRDQLSSDDWKWIINRK
jgi:hypothetical protein